MGKGIGILVNDGYAYKVLAPSASFHDSLLDLTTFGGDSAYQVWLDEGNIGTTTDFLADVGALVVNDVMATFSIDKMSANKAYTYDLVTGDILTTTFNINSVDKYVVSLGYDLDGVLETKRITRIDAKWVQYTFSYDVDGVLTNTTVTAG